MQRFAFDIGCHELRADIALGRASSRRWSNAWCWRCARGRRWRYTHRGRWRLGRLWSGRRSIPHRPCRRDHGGKIDRRGYSSSSNVLRWRRSQAWLRRAGWGSAALLAKRTRSKHNGQFHHATCSNITHYDEVMTRSPDGVVHCDCEYSLFVGLHRVGLAIQDKHGLIFFISKGDGALGAEALALQLDGLPGHERTCIQQDECQAGGSGNHRWLTRSTLIAAWA